MRQYFVPVMAATALVSLSAAAKADEIFLCSDSTLIYVNQANRAQNYLNPCVSGWFKTSETTAAAGVAPASKQSRAASERESSTSAPPAMIRAGKKS